MCEIAPVLMVRETLVMGTLVLSSDRVPV